jgi:hypothetical protein
MKITNHYGELNYNYCRVRNEVRAAFGLEMSLDQLLGHELGHAFGCLVMGECGPDWTTNTRWSLEFENYMRTGPYRFRHNAWPMSIDSSLE